MPNELDLRARLRQLASSGPAGCTWREPSLDEEYLTRCLAYLLRHSSNDSGVMVDSRGWASLTGVVEALRRMHWSLSARQLADFVDRSASGRFETEAGQVRARYGHSIPGLAVADPETPPEILFHGTTQ